MPLFGRKNRQPVEPVQQQRSGLFHRSPEPSYAEPQGRQSGIFGNRRNNVPANHRGTSPVVDNTDAAHNQKHGLFGRRSGSHSPTGRNGGLMHNNEDRSITNARNRVLNAEKAEMDAERARQTARTHVASARREVKALEREAEVE